MPKDRKTVVSRDVKFLGLEESKSTHEDFSPVTPDEQASFDKSCGTKQTIDVHHGGIKETSSSNDEPQRFEEQENADTSSCSEEPFRGFPRLTNPNSSLDDDPFRGFERTEVDEHGNPLLYLADNFSSDDEFYDAEAAMSAAEVSFKDATSGVEREEWISAIREEIRCLISNETWEIVEKPPNTKVIGCRTVLRKKYNPDGTLSRRKARVVAQGFSQRPARRQSSRQNELSPTALDTT